MPFEPHLIEPAAPPLDAAGDLVLDESLTKLAQQLQREALGLANRFPAERADSGAAIVCHEVGPSPDLLTTKAKGDSPGRAAHNMTLLSLAAIGLLGVAGSFVWMVPVENIPPRDTGSGNTKPAESSLLTSVDVVRTQEDDQPAVDTGRTRPVGMPYPLRTVPAGLTPSFSGPQWEGVLDLMEAEQADEPSVAI
jgi:hypothetical protein